MAGVYTVKQVNSYIKNMFKQDFVLNSVSIKGEISNCKYHSSGHIYFTLKDNDAILSVIMFSSQAAKLGFKLTDGMAVVANGRIDVYDAAGKYQLYANTITKEGIGDLYKKYEELKNTYEEMGYFAKEYKRPIPKITKRLGVVTSKTGAAVQDIINISTRRNPYIQLVLYPALVQGEQAKYSVAKGIATLDEYGLDCIIVGRGGGSIEDLWAFNEPEVIEAIFNAKTPIISAVGHETDFTIADFVSDLRAPTPSAAAELAVCNMDDLFNAIEDYRNRLYRAVNLCINFKRDQIERYKLRLDYLNPVNQVYEKRQRLMNIEDKLAMLMKNEIVRYRNRLNLNISRLDGVSPLKKLNQGFGFIEDMDNNHIVEVGKLNIGQDVITYLKDGSYKSKITEINYGKDIRG